MAKQSSKKTIFFFVFTFVNGVSSVTAAITAATNGEVTLKVEMGGQIDEVLWKHKGHKMVEWDTPAADPVEYLSFKERTVLDKTTGDVTIRKLTKADSGLYEAEVVVQGKLISKSHTVEVYDPVTEAKITCNSSGSMATLHCEAKGDLLSYSWSGDGLQSAEIQGQTRPQISMEKDQNSVYTCLVTNPVTSTSVNYHAKDCFSSDAGNVWLIVGAVVGGVVLLACCVAGYKWRQWKQQKSSQSSVAVKEPLLEQGISHQDPPTQPPEAQRTLINSPNTKVTPTVQNRSGEIHSVPQQTAQQTLDNTLNTANNSVSEEESLPAMSENADEGKNKDDEQKVDMEGGEGSGEVNHDAPAQSPETHTPDNSPNTADNMVSEVKHDPASASTDINHDSSSETVSIPTCPQGEQKTPENLGSSNSVASEENHSETKELTPPFPPDQPPEEQKTEEGSNGAHTDETSKNTCGGQNVEMEGGESFSEMHKNAQDTQQHTAVESSEVDAQSGPIKTGYVQKRMEEIERGQYRKPELDEASESTNGKQNRGMEGGDGSGRIHQNTPTAPLETHHTPDNSLNADNNRQVKRESEQSLHTDQDST